jgi:hypothetical protein
MMMQQFDHDEIDAALSANIQTLVEGALDVLAALILLLIGLVGLVHGLLRMMSGALGLLLWSLALFITFLYSLRAWAIARSSSSLHKE